MERMKWLYPGMRVKRWLVLLVCGIIVIATGFTLFFASNQPLVVWLGANKLGPLGSGIALITIGSLAVAIAIRFGIRSIISAIKPADVANLAQQVYRSRNLEKGPRIVTIGGGTGLGTMLRGLKQYSSNITAIVTVADDGGSSGKIREELGILPPGDVRSTLVALADTEPLMEQLFQYRFSWGDGLEGHSFGNLFIAAMTDITGDFEQAIKQFSKVLAVRGRVLPSTLATVRLGAEFADGSVVMGESNIPQVGKQIRRVFLDSNQAKALPEALTAIEQADIVVLGPGSLYTSVIPNLLLPSLVEALDRTSALRVYVCNVMTQAGETDGYSASDHVKAILNHVENRPILDYVVVNQAKITGAQSKKYAKEKAHPVAADLERLGDLGLKVRVGDYLDQQHLVRHDSTKLAEEIMILAAGHHHFWQKLNGDKAV